MPKISKKFSIKAGDFHSAGEGAVQIKSTLKSLDIDSRIVQRIAVCAYESEMNVVMHGGNGTISLIVEDKSVIIETKDDGPGIDDINLALTEGYSTAQAGHREMGFGAGMGLPNIRVNSDSMVIQSKEGEGTCLTMRFWLEKQD